MDKWLNRFQFLAGLGIALTLLVLLLGVATRLMDAGLGCPDWPGCYGKILVPSAEHAAQVSLQPLEPVKAWMEMVHRYAASSLGLLAIVLVVLSWRLRALACPLFKASLSLLALIILQGLFGMWTVTLKLWPVVVTLHLLGGLSCLLGFSLVYWLARRQTLEDAMEDEADTAEQPRRHNPLFWIALLALVAQISLGGWTSSNYAGVGCVGFPTCNGEWWPQADFAQGFHLGQQIGPDYLHGQLDAVARTSIHLSHRLGALILGLVIVALWWQQRTAPVSIRRFSDWLLLLYGLQIVVAVVMIALALPLVIALLHTLMAALLLLTLVQGGVRGMVWRPAAQPMNAVGRATKGDAYGH